MQIEDLKSAEETAGRCIAGHNRRFTVEGYIPGGAHGFEGIGDGEGEGG